MNMNNYICPRCHYMTMRKSNILHHIDRKVPCPDTFSSESLVDFSQKLKASSETRTCQHCRKTFRSQQYLDQHSDSCILSKFQSKLDEQTIEIEKLKSRPPINQINVQITINNFGSEDRSHISRDLLQHCIDSMKVFPLIDHIYFNSDHPENHTMKLKSEKRERLLICMNSSWIEVDMKATIDSIMLKENNALTAYFYEEIWNDPAVEFENKAFVQSKLVNLNEKNKSFFEQRRQIQAKLKSLS